jgi:hypothetical protein
MLPRIVCMLHFIILVRYGIMWSVRRDSKISWAQDKKDEAMLLSADRCMGNRSDAGSSSL